MPEYKLVKNISGNGYETIIDYHEDGSVYNQRWYLNGKKHREDGPAFIDYRKDGSIFYQSWYLNGIYLSKRYFTSYEMVERMKAHSQFTIKELLQLKRNV